MKRSDLIVGTEYVLADYLPWSQMAEAFGAQGLDRAKVRLTSFGTRVLEQTNCFRRRITVAEVELLEDVRTGRLEGTVRRAGYAFAVEPRYIARTAEEDDVMRAAEVKAKQEQQARFNLATQATVRLRKLLPHLGIDATVTGRVTIVLTPDQAEQLATLVEGNAQ